jgi:hypothetical protein
VKAPEALTKILQLPDNILPVSGIALGWPAEEKSERTQFEPSCVHQERW